MGETKIKAIAESYLKKLRALNLVGDGAFAFVFGVWAGQNRGEHEPIEIVVVDSRFGNDLIGEAGSLNAATWSVDTRIVPFPASVSEWENADDSRTLDRAKKSGVRFDL